MSINKEHTKTQITELGGCLPFFTALYEVFFKLASNPETEMINEAKAFLVHKNLFTSVEVVPSRVTLNLKRATVDPVGNPWPANLELVISFEGKTPMLLKPEVGLGSAENLKVIFSLFSVITVEN